LLKLVVCNSGLVTLSVSSNVYNVLEVGGKAQFYPDNTDLKYEATIARLAGSGAAKIYRALAIPPIREGDDQFDVLLKVPKLIDESGLNCRVGMTGHVFFDNRPLDWIRTLIN
jgi:hypothetical protein